MAPVETLRGVDEAEVATALLSCAEEMPEMKLLDVKLLDVNTLTPGGRVYPREVVERAVRDLVNHDGRMLVTLGGGMKMTDVAGQAFEMTLDDDGLHVDIELLNTPAGQLVQMAAVAGPQFRYQLSGPCQVAEDGTVKGMTITGVDMSIESKG